VADFNNGCYPSTQHVIICLTLSNKRKSRPQLGCQTPHKVGSGTENIVKFTPGHLTQSQHIDLQACQPTTQCRPQTLELPGCAAHGSCDAKYISALHSTGAHYSNTAQLHTHQCKFTPSKHHFPCLLSPCMYTPHSPTTQTRLSLQLLTGYLLQHSEYQVCALTGLCVSWCCCCSCSCHSSISLHPCPCCC